MSIPKDMSFGNYYYDKSFRFFVIFFKNQRGLSTGRFVTQKKRIQYLQY